MLFPSRSVALLLALPFVLHCGTPEDDKADTDTDVADTDVEDTDVTDTDVEDTDVEDTDVEDTDVEDTDVEDTDVEDTDVAALSFATDVAPILNASCTPCHIGGGSSGSMNLSSGVSAIVNVASVAVPTMDRVEPGDPANSYLSHKVHGTQVAAGGGGNQMPQNNPALSAMDLATIDQWITDGALP